MSDLQKYATFGVGVAVVGWLLHHVLMTQYPHDMNDDKMLAAHLAVAAALYFLIWDKFL
jgi:hypothetical protein